ncbi:hypothetical protein ABPG72_000419 [Tetrahymena utriculariae]
MELNKMAFKNILSTNQSPKGQSVINIQQQGQIKIRDLKIKICVTNSFLSVINLNQNYILQMEQVYLSDNKSPMQSIFLFNYLVRLVIKDSIFIKINLTKMVEQYKYTRYNNLNLQIAHLSQINQLMGYRGTVNYYNENSNGLFNITQSSFISNSALKEIGGAIYIYKMFY